MENHKVRCNGTMTEEEFLRWIRSALRSKFLRWPPRSKALDLAKIDYVGDNKRRKNSWVCAKCSLSFSSKEVEVDHFPKAAGELKELQQLPEFANNLFCEIDNLRVLCKDCHSIHTLSQRKGITEEQAIVLKKVISKEKEGVAEVKKFCIVHGYKEKHLTNKANRRKILSLIFERH